jgi:phenylacetate 2-hydroxylase
MRPSEKWWRQYGHSVFQIRLANTRVVVVKSFDDCRKMLLSHQNALIDRPKLYTSYCVISSTQGYTIDSSPWDEPCRKKRKAAGTALGRPALRNYHPPYVRSGELLHFTDLYRDSKDGEAEVSVRPYLQRYALNTTLTLCYGIRMDEVTTKFSVRSCTLVRQYLSCTAQLRIYKITSRFSGTCPTTRRRRGRKNPRQARQVP